MLRESPFALVLIPLLTHCSLCPAKVLVKQLSGKECMIVASPTDTIRTVKGIIEYTEGTPRERQRLITIGEEREDGATLQECMVTQVMLHLFNTAQQYTGERNLSRALERVSHKTLAASSPFLRWRREFVCNGYKSVVYPRWVLFHF